MVAAHPAAWHSRAASASLARVTTVTPFSAPTSWTELAARVWVGVVEPDAVNVGLVAGRDGAVLVDCGSSPAQGAAIRVAAEEHAGVPITGVVVTHWHHDHAFGLAAFADLDTIGHESVPERLGSDAAAAEASRLGLDPQTLTPPSRTLSLVAAVDLGGDRRVEIVHLGRAHTDGDVVVVVPGTDVIFAGDLIESSGPPQSGPDSSVAEWPNALDALIGLMTDDTRAVPGHGDPVDREFVFQARGQAAMAVAESGGDRPPPGRTELPLL